MNNNFKLKLLAAAVLMASGAAHAGSAFLNGSPTVGDGSQANPYDFGVVGASVSALFVNIGGPANGLFEEYANFTIPTLSGTSGAANTYALSFFGVNVIDIQNLVVEVWDNVHPGGSTLYTTFTGDNLTHAFGNLTAGQYHLDISGQFGPNAFGGQYSVALQALPVPEPETYAMLLAGLGLVGFSVRRRKIA